MAIGDIPVSTSLAERQRVQIRVADNLEGLGGLVGGCQCSSSGKGEGDGEDVLYGNVQVEEQQAVPEADW